MNLTRLMVLGTLDQYGPRHGHEIRRIAEVTNVGEWGGVSVGALYRELRTMEAEGLVETVRTERVGRRPARTVYAITSEGKLELSVLAEQAIRSNYLPPDPLGVALSFAETGTDREQLATWLHSRREMFALRMTELEVDRQRLEARGVLDPLRAAVMYRGQLHAETEVRWHDELAKILAELPEDEPAGDLPDRPDGEYDDPAKSPEGGLSGDSASELPGKTGRKPPGGSAGELSGKTGRKWPGDAAGGLPGKTGRKMPGNSVGELAGKTGRQPARRAGRRPAGGPDATECDSSR